MLIKDEYFDIDNLYYSKYHGEMKQVEQNKILDNFLKSKYGIIVCVYCLGLS